MSTVPIMPESGQFAAVWVYNSKIWSCTLRWVGGELMCYSIGSEDDERECWVVQYPSTYVELNAIYIIE